MAVVLICAGEIGNTLPCWWQTKKIENSGEGLPKMDKNTPTESGNYFVLCRELFSFSNDFSCLTVM